MAPKRERTLFCQKDLHRNKMSISLYASPSEFMLKKKTFNHNENKNKAK